MESLPQSGTLPTHMAHLMATDWSFSVVNHLFSLPSRNESWIQDEQFLVRQQSANFILLLSCHFGLQCYFQGEKGSFYAPTKVHWSKGLLRPGTLNKSGQYVLTVDKGLSYSWDTGAEGKIYYLGGERSGNGNKANVLSCRQPLSPLQKWARPFSDPLLLWVNSAFIYSIELNYTSFYCCSRWVSTYSTAQVSVSWIRYHGLHLLRAIGLNTNQPYFVFYIQHRINSLLVTAFGEVPWGSGVKGRVKV